MKKEIVILFIISVTDISLTKTISIIPDSTIQWGISIASHGDTVLVHPGEYVENINFNGKNIILGSLYLTTGDTSYISNTIINGNNQTNVVTLNQGEDSTAMLIGFTITNGNTLFGGGVFCSDGSSPILKRLKIINNHAVCGGGICCQNNSLLLGTDLCISNNSADMGGGTCCENANIILMNTKLDHNHATNEGGGLFCFDGSSVTLINNTITQNHAVVGGGISADMESKIILENVIISKNQACGLGGGISCSFCIDTKFKNVSILSNSATESGSQGGGMYCTESELRMSEVILSGNKAGFGGGIFFGLDFGLSPFLKNIFIQQNKATYKGGGVFCQDADVTFQNAVIADNQANEGGAVTCESYADPIFINATIVNNTAKSAVYGGGMVCYYDSNPTLINTIFFNNMNKEIIFVEHGPSNSVTLAFSDIKGGEEGIIRKNNGSVYWLNGNINKDPLFVSDGNYHLSGNSPCIETGIDSIQISDHWYFTASEDIEHNPRPNPENSHPDMGAFEHYSNATVIQKDAFPKIFYIDQNFPNPFNPSTTIRYYLPRSDFVTLHIYNLAGQKIETSVNGYQQAGAHEIIWTAEGLPSGMYFYRLQAFGFSETKKLILRK